MKVELLIEVKHKLRLNGVKLKTSSNVKYLRLNTLDYS